MKIDDALRSAGAVLVRRPSKVLPAFVAESGSALVVQAVGLVAMVLAYVSLLGTGRIEAFFQAYREFTETVQSSSQSGTPFGPFAGSDPAVEAAVEELGRAMANLLTPTVLAIGALAIVVGLAVGVVVRAVVGAAKVHTALAAMEDGRPILAAVEGAREDFVPFLAFTVVQSLVFAGLAGLGVVGIGLTVAGAQGGSIVVALLGIVVTLAAPVGAVIAYFLLLFVPEAIVTDGVGFLGGVRRNLGYLRAHPLRALAFIAVFLGIRMAIGSVAVVLQFVGMSRVVPLVSLFAFAPYVGLLKLGLYADLEPPTFDRPLNVTDALVGGGRRSVDELRRFVADRADLVALAMSLFVGGGVVGYVALDAVGVTLAANEGANDALFGAFGTIPLEDFVQIAANNWLVALRHSFAGLALGIPTVANLLFNGMFVGGLAALTPTDTRVFAALILPHGIIEIPALSTSGALGLYLSVYAARYLGGSVDAEVLAAQIHRAFYVLLGLIPVFVIASFVETFITPFVGKGVQALIGA